MRQLEINLLFFVEPPLKHYHRGDQQQVPFKDHEDPLAEWVFGGEGAHQDESHDSQRY